MTDIVVTKDGKRVPAFSTDHYKFLDKTIVLYGKSNSGKTTIVKYILYLLKNYVPLAFVISPTEPSNHAYEDFIDKTLIHYDLTIDKKEEDSTFLDKFWSWQEMRASLYNKAKRLDVLKTLVGRFSDAALDTMANKVEQKRAELIKDSTPNKISDINKMCDDLLIRLYKKFINQNRQKYQRIEKDLTEDEKYSLKYLDLNPHVVLIFDDCAAEIKPFLNKPIIKRLFYQSRHSYITVIFCCQDDTDLIAALRKNVAINIFTQGIVANANFGRPSNKFGRDVVSYCAAITPDIFVGHRKLVYIDNDPDKQYFYHMTAGIVPNFKFGSPSVGTICDKVKSENGNIDRSNKYYSHFRV